MHMVRPHVHRMQSPSSNLTNGANGLSDHRSLAAVEDLPTAKKANCRACHTPRVRLQRYRAPQVTNSFDRPPRIAV